MLERQPHIARIADENRMHSIIQVAEFLSALQDSSSTFTRSADPVQIVQSPLLPRRSTTYDDRFLDSYTFIIIKENMSTDSHPWITNENSSPLTSLPLELVLEILKMLDWRDILHLQTTCKFLSVLTKTKSIWADLVDRHISGIDNRPLRLGQPAALYTSEEMRSIFLLWKSAETGLNDDDGKPSRQRRFIAERSRCVHLVRGGRWLLVRTNTGLVMYYDLDAEIIEGALLIPEQSKPVSELLVSVDVDNSSPTLKFNIAFSLHVARPKSITAHVWQVNTLLDDNQCVIGLKATHLASFPHRPVIRSVLELSLVGPHIAFAAIRQDTQFYWAYIFIIDWDRANGDSAITYPWRILNRDPLNRTAKIHLLPSDRILVLNVNITLFDYSRVQETEDTSLRDEQGLGLQRIWASSLYVPQPYDTYGPYFTSTGARILAMIDTGIGRMIRSVDIHSISAFNANMGMVEVMEPSPQFVDVPYVGHSRALAVVENDGVETWFLLDYSNFSTLDQSEAEFTGRHPIQKAIVGQLSRAIWKPILDEESGRIVSPIGRSKEITVLDFARVFRTRN